MNEQQQQPNQNGGFDRISQQVLAWLRTRTADHWVMFFLGLVAGLIMG